MEISRDTRDGFLDAVKVLALLRVFLWHSTSWPPLTYVASIPVMILVAGFFFEKSRTRSDTTAVIKSRLRRLMIPFWLFSVLAISVMAAKDSSFSFLASKDALSWILPLRNPVGATWQQGWITEPLWYLRAYLWLLLASPMLVKISTRWPGEVLAVFAIAVVVCEQWFGTSAWAFQDFVLYGFFWTLGMLLSRRHSAEPGRGVFGLAVLMSLVSVGFYFTQKPIGGVVNNSHTLHLLVGCSTLAVLWSVRRHIEAVFKSTLLTRLTRGVSNNSLTVYLYHAPMLGVAYLLLGTLGLKEGLILTCGASLLGVLLTYGAVKFAGPVEQWSKKGARNKDALTSVKPLRVLTAKTSALAAVLFAAITIAQPSSSAVFVPQTPSKAPEAAVFEVDSDEQFLLEGSNASVNQGALEATGSQRLDNNTRAGSSRNTPSTSTPPTKAPSTKAPRRPTTVHPVPVLTSVESWNDAAPDMSAEKQAAIELLFTRWAAKNHLPSAQLGLLLPGRAKLLLSADSEGVLQTPPTSVAYHSVTKSFTAALLLRAVAEGKIALDDKVGILEAAPWFGAARDVTLAQLLGHRSGLTPYAATQEFKEKPESIDSWETALRAVQNATPQFTPGASIEYSSSNFIVAGLLAAQLYGAPVESLIERELLTPLSLSSVDVKKPFPGSPGTGTGNAEGSLQDIMRWTRALWRDAAVLGVDNASVASYAENNSNLGYGTFAYCPCTSSGLKAAYGTNGAQITSRYYAALDIVILVRTSSGVPPSVEELISEVLRELS